MQKASLVAGIVPEALPLEFLQPVETREEILQRAGRMRYHAIGGLVGVELLKAAVLHDPFRLVVAEHAVEVERDPQFVVMVVHERRFHHLACGEAFPEGLPDVFFVGGEEKRHGEHLHVSVRRPALREDGPRDLQLVMLD
ncbi:hypothetical protein RPX00_40665 [Amycolatopsis sp. WGS_07]